MSIRNMLEFRKQQSATWGRQYASPYGQLQRTKNKEDMAKPKAFEYKKPGANGTAVRAIHSALGRLNDAIPLLRDASNDAIEAVMEARNREQERIAARADLRTELRNSTRRGPHG